MKEQTMVKVDKDVLVKFRNTLEGETVNQYLKRIVEKREDPIEALRSSMLKRMDDIQKQIDNLDKSIVALFGDHDEQLITLAVTTGIIMDDLDVKEPGKKDLMLKQIEVVTKKVLEAQTEEDEEVLKNEQI
jgi:hypothetical protein